MEITCSHKCPYERSKERFNTEKEQVMGRQNTERFEDTEPLDNWELPGYKARNVGSHQKLKETKGPLSLRVSRRAWSCGHLALGPLMLILNF